MNRAPRARRRESRTEAIVRRALIALIVLAGCSIVASPGSEPGPREERPAQPAAPARDPVRQPAPPPESLLPTSEVRALWVVRSTLTSEAEVRALVENAEAAGFNTLLVQVRGRGDAFYRSTWEPRSESITDGPGFDPLGTVLELAHARGIAVHAWVNTHLVWNTGPLPADRTHIVRAHPEWLAVPRALGRELVTASPHSPSFVEALRQYALDNTGTVEGLYTSPSDPRVKERVRSIWVDLTARYAELDGIHFDYVRFPSGAYDYSRGALDRFARWVSPRLPPDRRIELSRAAASDPFAWVDALPGPWAEFRRAQITELVRMVYHTVKARRPDIVVSAAVFANRDDAYENRFQDWAAWLEEGILDVAVPMAYTTDHARFERHVADGVAAAGPGRLWAGLGAYLNSTEGTLRQIDIARAQGVAGVSLFSYDWAVGEGYAGQGPTLLEEIGRTRFSR